MFDLDFVVQEIARVQISRQENLFRKIKNNLSKDLFLAKVNPNEFRLWHGDMTLQDAIYSVFEETIKTGWQTTGGNVAENKLSSVLPYFCHTYQFQPAAGVDHEIHLIENRRKRIYILDQKSSPLWGNGSSRPKGEEKLLAYARSIDDGKSEITIGFIAENGDVETSYWVGGYRCVEWYGASAEKNLLGLEGLLADIDDAVNEKLAKRAAASVKQLAEIEIKRRAAQVSFEFISDKNFAFDEISVVNEYGMIDWAGLRDAKNNRPTKTTQRRKNTSIPSSTGFLIE